VSEKRDLIILGGGLAGMGLALQVKKRQPDLHISVVEKNAFPRPPAIAKVGESTVEIGSFYLSHQLELEAHLDECHLRKFGLRLFTGVAERDFSECDELGPSQTFGIPTYQLDRGVLENHLAAQLRTLDIELIDQADVREIQVEDDKSVAVATPAGARNLQSRWLVDTSGRAAILKKHLTLQASSEHRANAVWFRIDRRVVVDDWTVNPIWQARSAMPRERWKSTVHLTGPGYWVWIIPLESGVTSVGIVMDDPVFAAAGIRDSQSAVRWLEQHQPRCADAIAGAHFLDFVVLPNYAYDCKKVLSADRWAISGEAGFFADPFYSPGSDFIAIANGFITSLIADDRRGNNIQLNAVVYEKIFRSIYQNTLSLYTNQYGGFGDRLMMGLKTLWDFAYYWGVLSLLYFRNALCDYQKMRPLINDLIATQELNQEIQALFRERAKRRLVLPASGVFLDQYKVPCLKYFNDILQKPLDADVQSDLQKNIKILHLLAGGVAELLQGISPADMSSAAREWMGDYCYGLVA
jgi:flavin-dependent dehydrogenase